MLFEANSFISRSWAINRNLEAWLVVIVMLFVFTIFGAHSVIHLDVARDLTVGSEIVAGSLVPLTGPLLAGVIELGPVWYYFLAALQIFGLQSSGSIIAIAVLASAQFILIYLSGKRVLDDNCGLIWCSLVLLPSWSTFQLIFITHTAFSGLFVAATIYSAIVLYQTGRPVSGFAMCFCFSIGIHAHPSVAVIWFVVLAVLCVTAIRYGSYLSLFFAAFLGSLIPFIPFLFYQVSEGWPVLHGISDFGSQWQSTSDLGNTMPLLWQTIAGGLRYWLLDIVGVGKYVANLLTVVILVVYLAGFVGALRLLMSGSNRLISVFVIALVPASITLVSLRAVYPYYMLAAIELLVAMVAAIGLACVIRGIGPSVQLSRLIIASSLALFMTVFISSAIQLREGGFPFSFLPLFDVISEGQKSVPQPFMPASASSINQAFLCGTENIAVHGAYGLSMVHSYGIDLKFACPDSVLRIKGDEPEMQRYLGVSRRVADSISRPELFNIGPYSLFPVHASFIKEGWLLHDLANYPPFLPNFGQPRALIISLEGLDGRLLAVTDYSFALAPKLEVQLMCAEMPRAPIAEDNITWVYEMEACEGPLALHLRTTVPDLIDVVSF
jgi:hypothetical protein